MFRLTGNQQTRQSLTTYFWSLWYSRNVTWLGASSSAYKQPGALHTPHAYTLAWCFGSQFGFFFFFFVIVFLFLPFFCVSAPLCASARLVVLKGFDTNPSEKMRSRFLNFFLLPSFFPNSIAIPIPQPSRYRPTCKHGKGVVT